MAIRTTAPRRAQLFYPAFSSGELAPSVAVRPDMDKWIRGAGMIKNLVVRPEGGLIRRPGTRIIRELIDSSKTARQIPFVYSGTQGISIELQEYTARFYQDGGYLYHELDDVSEWDIDVSYVLNEVCKVASTIYRCIQDAAPLAVACQSLSSTGWANGSNTMDDDEDTYATESVPAESWSDDLEYSYGHLGDDWYSNAFKFFVHSSTPASITVVKVEMYYDGAWNEVYNDSVVTDEWVQVALEDTHVLGQYRITFYNSATEAKTVAFSDFRAYVVNKPGISPDYWVADDIVRLATPYAVEDLADIDYVQSGDTLFIYHPDYKPRKLTRNSATDWTLEEYTNEWGPFLTENTDDITITPSAVTGTIDLVASDDIFVAGHVGALFQLRQRVDSETDTIKRSETDSYWADSTSYSVGNIRKVATEIYEGDTDYEILYVCIKAHTSATATNKPGTGSEWQTYWRVGIISEELECRGDWEFSTDIEGNGYYWFGLQRSIDGGDTWTTYKSKKNSEVIWEGTEDEDADPVTLLRAVILAEKTGSPGTVRATISVLPYTHSGVVQIATVTDGQNATATVVEELGNTNATLMWSEGAWSDYRGWPRSASFAKGRQLEGGNDHKRTQIWGSKPDDFPDFKRHFPVVDSDGLDYPLNSMRGDIINYLIPLRSVIVLTSDAEWAISPGSDAGAFSPTDILAETHSYRGSARVKPAMVGDSAIFVQRGQRTLRSIGYNLNVDGYAGSNLTVFAKHLFKKAYTMGSLAYQQEPWSVVWGSRSDGYMLGLTLEMEQNIFAWHRHALGYDGDCAEVEDVCCVPDSDGDDILYLVVKRSWTDSEDVTTTKRYIEYLKPNEDDFETYGGVYLDCSISGDLDTASTTITGLSVLEGRTVSVLYRDADGDYHYESGKTVASGQITVTTAAVWASVGYPYESRLETLSLDMQGSTLSKPKKAVRVDAIFENFYSDGLKVGTREGDLKEPTYPPLDSGTFWEEYRMDALVDAAWSKTAKVIISQPEPWPVTILSLLPEVVYGN